MAEKKRKTGKKIVQFLIGFLCLIIGITLILAWWPEVVALFKGFIGMVLALIGLIVLYLVKD